MLAESCDICSTVLMQDRRGRVICVKCESESMANAVGRMELETIANGKIRNGNLSLNNVQQESNVVQKLPKMELDKQFHLPFQLEKRCC